ncbi:MAG TPA: hypothetical protein VMR51_02090 [Patescibacteria group bacterium]|nr:hypothetical protein [Patescibacteria group bacterium]
MYETYASSPENVCGKEIDQDLLNSVNLAEYLHRNSLTEKPLSSTHLDGYSLIPLRVPDGQYLNFGWVENFYDYSQGYALPKQYIDGNFYKLWLNTNVGFALCYKDSPNAMIGLDLDWGNEILIKQIQGVIAYKDNVGSGKRHSRGLAPLDWRKLMVELSEDIADRLGFIKTAIESAKTVSSSPQNRFMSPERAKDIYDETASRLGYTMEPDGYWHRRIA